MMRKDAKITIINVDTKNSVYPELSFLFWNFDL